MERAESEKQGAVRNWDTLRATSSTVVWDLLLGGRRNGERKEERKDGRDGARESVCHVTYLAPLNLAGKHNCCTVQSSYNYITYNDVMHITFSF